MVFKHLCRTSEGIIDAIFYMGLQTTYSSIIIHLSITLQKPAKLSLLQSLIQSYGQLIYRRTAINVSLSWLIEAAEVSLSWLIEAAEVSLMQSII